MGQELRGEGWAVGGSARWPVFNDRAGNKGEGVCCTPHTLEVRWGHPHAAGEGGQRALGEGTSEGSGFYYPG